MDDNIKNIILDFTVGTDEYWKWNFANVLEDIQIHTAETLVYVCFCDNNNNIKTHRRIKEIYIDIEDLMEYIETSKFKDKLIHEVLELLLNMNHPLYDLIECELARG